MLPETHHYGGWAASGEIDILEAVNLGVRCDDCAGGIENRILGTLHFGGQWPDNKYKGDETALPAPLDGFHVFGIVWQRGKIVWTEIGRASCRERGCQYGKISVVDVALQKNHDKKKTRTRAKM